MNTKEFMELVNIKNHSTVTHYIQTEVINPVKEGKSYNFTQVEVDKIIRHRSHSRQIVPPTLIYDLSQVPSRQMITELELRGIDVVL